MKRPLHLFKRLDIGDIVWHRGAGLQDPDRELTIDVEENGLRLLSKSLASPAGEVARPHRRRDPLPPAPSRSDRQSRCPQGVS
ncbi:MAG: hypothetical protein MZV70_48675 [Desulfobacterales bacterium]|nr:hypothetical protein [Desulfobacterales bacterium]